MLLPPQEVHPQPALPLSRLRNHALLFSLVGPEQGAVFPLHGTDIHVGRGSAVDVALDDDAVSTRHARLVRRSDGIYLMDDGSRNGTFLNDGRVSLPQRLNDGDHIRVGNTILRFSMVDALEERALVSLFELTVRDPLTRAYNRRYLMPHLRSELSFAARQGMSLAVLIVDIDFFKRVNDAYGHAVGDVVLQLVANTIQRLLRPYDVLCRYGGEEFVVVARDTSLRNAEILAQRIRNHVESVRFDVDGGTDAVTVSVGVTAVAPEVGSEDADALLIAADDALYVAKEAGRNRVRTSVVPRASSAPASTRRALTAPPAIGSLDAMTFDLKSPELSRAH